MDRKKNINPTERTCIILTAAKYCDPKIKLITGREMKIKVNKPHETTDEKRSDFLENSTAFWFVSKEEYLEERTLVKFPPN